jgi:flavin reductase (DIM6/NTAB) family NADH-FMN oxidoreductase RutF
MKTIDPANVPAPDFYKLLTATIGPRPIAFASTIDAAGRVNLSPFSFFNVFGSNPPTLILSTAVTRQGTQKHTLQNVREVAEITISVVSYSMVEQMSLASAEFDKGVNEFVKAGFTERPSEVVRPPGVAEAPASFECRVKQIIETGTEPGAGNLLICEVIRGHFRDDIFDDKGIINPHRVDLIGRLGGDWYCRASGDALFSLARPQVGIGVDQLPESIRTSNILTGNDLGKLGSFKALPPPEAVQHYQQSGVLNDTFDEARHGCQYLPDLLHLKAKQLLAENKVEEAWLTLLQV